MQVKNKQIVYFFIVHCLLNIFLCNKEAQKNRLMGGSQIIVKSCKPANPRCCGIDAVFWRIGLSSDKILLHKKYPFVDVLLGHKKSSPRKGLKVEALSRWRGFVPKGRYFCWRKNICLLINRFLAGGKTSAFFVQEKTPRRTGLLND